MRFDDMQAVWGRGKMRGPLDSVAGPDRLLYDISQIEKNWRKRNLMTVGAFVVVAAAMGFFVSMLQLQTTLSWIGVMIAGLAMLTILGLKWYRQTGVRLGNLDQNNRTFLNRAARKLRFARWLVVYGVACYIGLFAVGFTLMVPELFAGRAVSTKLMAMAIGYGYLLLLAIQGIARAKREYNRDVAPVLARVERAVQALGEGQ